MASNDPIADMLTRVRNAAKASFSSVDIPGSKLKIEIARVLKEEGYVKNFKFIKDAKQGVLRIYLKYGPGRSSAFLNIERASKPSRRVYSGSRDIQPVLDGMGIAIVSTSKGLMTDKRARKENLGGEILCRVW